MNEPTSGRYVAVSCGTVYEALNKGKHGWWIQKQPKRGPAPPAYQKPDFPAACNAGIFTKLPDPSNG